MKLCKTCKLEKELCEFGPNKKSADGKAYVCKPCRAEYELNRRASKGIIPKVKPKVIDDSKECLRCHEIKHIDEFAMAKRGRLGRAAYCKICSPLYIKELKSSDKEHYTQKGREATQKYRANNRERWRALHRINQFNRKNLQKATSDDTVTDDFLRSIYNTEKCFWCGRFTEKDKRTCEHVIPLILGGLHSANNITMACLSCNSSKINFKNDNIKNT